MKLTLHVVLIVAAVLVAAALLQKSSRSNPTPEEAQNANMQRNVAYLLLAVAAGLALYCCYSKGSVQSAEMRHYAPMYGSRRAYMCGARH